MAYTDRAYTPQQEGAPLVSWPLQEKGDYYCKTTRRTMVSLAGEYAPIIGTLTSFTNQITYSELFANAAWTATALTITDNNSTDPYGGTTMSRLVETAANSEHSVSQAANVTAAATEAMCFFKGGLTRQNVKITFTDSAAATFSSFFNFSNGTVGATGANTTAQIMNIGRSVYCGVIRFTPAAGAGTLKINLASDSSTISYAGNTSCGLYAWGAQVSAGNNAPYINTTNVARAVSSPPVDSDQSGRVQDPLSLLCVETEPDQASTAAGYAKWDRVYSRIPRQLVNYSTLAITKPDAGALGVGYNYYESGASSIGTLYLYSEYAFDSYNNEVYGLIENCTSVTSGSNTRITLASTAGYNIATGFAMYTAFTNSWYHVSSGGWSIIDGTNIDILGVDFGTFITRIGNYYRDYTPGPDRVKVKLVTDYYMPGFTSGIATADDIPVPDPLINDAAFLSEVIASTSGYVNYDSSPLDFWYGPIYSQESQQVDFGGV